jgi:hypothetical protein
MKNLFDNHDIDSLLFNATEPQLRNVLAHSNISLTKMRELFEWEARATLSETLEEKRQELEDELEVRTKAQISL